MTETNLPFFCYLCLSAVNWSTSGFVHATLSFNCLKSFCLRDRGRLGNGGWPISLKIGTQSRYVDLC